MEGEGCLVLHPSKEEFSRPFVEYVTEVFARHPGTACFKVIPPKGYSPRQAGLPKFQDVKINTPIKQYVSPSCLFSGAVDCLPGSSFFPRRLEAVLTIVAGCSGPWLQWNLQVHPYGRKGMALWHLS